MENDETPRRQHMWKVSALGWQWLSDPDIYSKELKTNICTDICTWLFISAHMGIYSSCIDNTRTCEQPKCPWVSGWTHKHHTMAVFSALKMHALSCLGETSRNLKRTSVNEQSHLKRLHGVQYMTFRRTQRYDGDSKTINSGQEFRMREGWKVVTKTTWGNGNSLNEDVVTKSLYICSDPWSGWGQEWIGCGSVVVATVSLR